MQPVTLPKCHRLAKPKPKAIRHTCRAPAATSARPAKVCRLKIAINDPDIPHQPIKLSLPHQTWPQPVHDTQEPPALKMWISVWCGFQKRHHRDPQTIWQTKMKWGVDLDCSGSLQILTYISSNWTKGEETHRVVLLGSRDFDVGVGELLAPVRQVARHARQRKEDREELRREPHRAVHQPCTATLKPDQEYLSCTDRMQPGRTNKQYFTPALRSHTSHAHEALCCAVCELQTCTEGTSLARAQDFAFLKSSLRAELAPCLKSGLYSAANMPTHATEGNFNACSRMFWSHIHGLRLNGFPLILTTLKPQN